MRRIYYSTVALAMLATAATAWGQKTAYGYTMLPSTTPSMISFTTDEPTTTSRLGGYSKAEPRSGAMVGETLYMMGIDDDFNVWFYSMDCSGNDGETIKKLGDATIPGDMSYDYSTNTMYFIANSENVDGVSAYGTVDLESGKMTFVHDLPYYCKAIAVDARGQMYVLTNSAQLVRVNKGSGEVETVGSTGVTLASWWNFQSMEFDRETGALYLAAWGSDEKSTLYSIDTASGLATKVGVIGNGAHTIALSMPYAPSSSTAPERVKDLTLTADPMGELTATLSWTNPENDYSGTPLEDMIDIEIVNKTTGEKTVLEHCAPGERMSYTLEVAVSGMYTIAVSAVNASGASLEQSVEGWIGVDVPGEVTDARAMLSRTSLLVNELSWTAPASGAHGGYMDRRDLVYDVIRMNDGKTIARDLTVTHVSDDKLLDDLTRYSYQIIARNGDGTSNGAKTNDLVNGPAVKCPYEAPFNSWEESGQYWTVLDGNGDGYPFVWYKDYMNMFGQGFDKCYYIYQKNEVHYGYDFIISPPIEFQEGHEYKITATVSNDDIAGYREEQFRFYTFGGYDMAGAIPLGDEPFTVKHPGEFRDYSFTFKAEDDGYGSDDEKFASFIALCCCSRYDMGMLLVSRIAVEDLTPAVAIGDVNGDGEVNIADVNALINIILNGKSTAVADVNADGEVNIADVNALIDIILNK